MSARSGPTICHGGCLCGGVRYEILGDLAPVQFCHCSQCRKAQGSAFAANIPVEADGFRLLAGADKLKDYESSPGKRRTFCAECGSPILSRIDTKPGVVRVRAGSLDDESRVGLGFHFHVASSASWWTISDELPQYAEARPV